MSDKHTLGPWKVKGATIWGCNGPLAVVQGPSQPTMDGAHIEPEANRRLIAAAPTMLEALECAIAGFQRDFNYVCQDGLVEFCLCKDCQIRRIKAAIKAAKGEA